MLEQAITLAKAGDKMGARVHLLQIVAQDSDNEYAWGWLAYCAATNQERHQALTQVVRINPSNEPAHRALAKLNEKMRAAAQRSEQKRQLGEPTSTVSASVTAGRLRGFWQTASRLRRGSIAVLSLVVVSVLFICLLELAGNHLLAPNATPGPDLTRVEEFYRVDYHYPPIERYIIQTLTAEAAQTLTPQTSGTKVNDALQPAATPQPSETPVPSRTLKPTISPTNTPLPTLGPWPFMLVEDGVIYTQHPSWEGCNWLGIAGEVWDRDGEPITGIAVVLNGGGRENNISFSGQAPDYGPSGWEHFLDNKVKAGVFQVQLWREGEPISEAVTVHTRRECRANLAYVIFQSALDDQIFP